MVSRYCAGFGGVEVEGWGGGSGIIIFVVVTSRPPSVINPSRYRTLQFYSSAGSACLLNSASLPYFCAACH